MTAIAACLADGVESTLNRARVAALLLYAPNPHTFLAWTPAELIAFLRQHLGFGGPRTAERILAVLRQAPLPPPEVAAIRAARLQAEYQRETRFF